MPETLTYAISGTGLVLTAVSTGAALWQVYIKRRERREAVQRTKQEEEGDARVMAVASGVQNTLQTQEGIASWARENKLTLYGMVA